MVDTFLVSYDEFKKATEAELAPMRVHEGTLGDYIPSDTLGDGLEWKTYRFSPVSVHVRVEHAGHHHRLWDEENWKAAWCVDLWIEIVY